MTELSVLAHDILDLDDTLLEWAMRLHEVDSVELEVAEVREVKDDLRREVVKARDRLFRLILRLGFDHDWVADAVEERLERSDESDDEG